MQDMMHDDDPQPDCPWCKKAMSKCICDKPLACGIENPDQCESCT